MNVQKHLCIPSMLDCYRKSIYKETPYFKHPFPRRSLNNKIGRSPDLRFTGPLCLPIHLYRVQWTLTAFLNAYSGGTVLDLHQLPFSPSMSSTISEHERNLFVVIFIFLFFRYYNVIFQYCKFLFHYNFPFTPAAVNVDISFKIFVAAWSTGYARAAPVPSPSLKLKFKIGVFSNSLIAC